MSEHQAQKFGWLVKQGSFRKTWKRKYFILHWPELRYYSCEPEGPQHAATSGKVILVDDVTLSDSLSMVKGSSKENAFGIFHNSRDPVFLQAETKEEMMAWVNAIRNEQTVGMIDFDQLRTLGEGSFGQVWLVRHRTTDDLLAMKVLDKARTRADDAVSSTRIERDILLRVRHPFVVQMQYAFQTADKLFMVMDYHNGGDLYSHMLQQVTFKEGPVRLWMGEIALAIGYLHEIGCVFRDLKPENVLLDAAGHAHLTDFGLSKLVESTHVHGAALRLTTFCGSPFYLAPELVRTAAAKRHKGKAKNAMGYGKDVDWWALGVLAHELLIGQPPFQGAPPFNNAQAVYRAIVNTPMETVRRRVEQQKGLSPETVQFMFSLLERDIDKRLGSGDAGLRAVQAHPFFFPLAEAAAQVSLKGIASPTDRGWTEAVLARRLVPEYSPAAQLAKAGKEDQDAADEVLSGHYSRKMQAVEEVAPRPEGLVERVRRRSAGE